MEPSLRAAGFAQAGLYGFPFDLSPVERQALSNNFDAFRSAMRNLNQDNITQAVISSFADTPNSASNTKIQTRPWRDEETGKPWLASVPLITMLPLVGNQRPLARSPGKSRSHCLSNFRNKST
jgi:hypothetical protein